MSYRFHTYLDCTKKIKNIMALFSMKLHSRCFTIELKIRSCDSECAEREVFVRNILQTRKKLIHWFQVAEREGLSYKKILKMLLRAHSSSTMLPWKAQNKPLWMFRRLDRTKTSKLWTSQRLRFAAVQINLSTFSKNEMKSEKTGRKMVRIVFFGFDQKLSQ